MIEDKQLVPYYLMSCHLYYEKNESVLSDKEFDDVCHRLVANWTKIKHPHKKLIKKGSIQAQTGYNNKNYPNIVKLSALQWLDESKNNPKPKEPEPVVDNGIDDLFE